MAWGTTGAMARVGVSSSEEGDIHLERSNSIPICSPAAEADSKTLAPDVCHSVADEAFSASRGGALEDVQDILAALAFVDFSRQSSRKTLVARRSSFAQALKENGHLVLPRLSKSYTAVSLVESARRWTTVAGPSYDVPSLISPSNSTSVAQNITESDPDEDVGESRIHSNRQPPPTNCRRHTASNSGETAQSLPCLSLEVKYKLSSLCPTPRRLLPNLHAHMTDGTPIGAPP